MQLFTLIENEIIRSDKEIEDISKLRIMYTRYFSKMEKLWTEFQGERISEEDASDKYFNYKDIDWINIETLDTELNIKEFKKLMISTERDTNNYIHKYHKS